MRSQALVVVGVLAVILTAGPASAKEFSRAKVCGKSSCARIDDESSLRLFALTGSGSTRPPAGPFYTVELFVGDGHGGEQSWTLDYVPGVPAIRVAGEFGSDDWWTLDTNPSPELLAELKAVDPYPAAAYAVAMDHPPGSFSADDFEALPDPKGAQSTTGRSPDPTETGWILPALLLAMTGAVIVGGLALTRRRATAA